MGLFRRKRDAPEKRGISKALQDFISGVDEEYNSSKLAATQLQKEPLCTEGLNVGRLQRAEIVDNIKPIREG